MEAARAHHSRCFLQAELAARHEKNPRYSLRAFARSLGVSHTLVSLVLSGKRPMSRKMAARIGERLAMDPAERERFLRTGSPAVAPSKTTLQVEAPSTRINLDQFAVISEWQHYAILSLLELEGSRFEAKWISGRLGIGEMQAKLAMDRLARMKLVSKGPRGWRQSGHPIRIDNVVSTAGTRRFHKQLLEKAAESLDNDPIEERDFRSMTFALDSALLPLAKERIKDFRRALVEELESLSPRPDRVYHLGFQVFPLSGKQKPNPLKSNSKEKKK